MYGVNTTYLLFYYSKIHFSFQYIYLLVILLKNKNICSYNAVCHHYITYKNILKSQFLEKYTINNGILLENIHHPIIIYTITDHLFTSIVSVLLHGLWIIISACSAVGDPHPCCCLPLFL